MSPSPRHPDLLVTGPEQHGVVRYARDLARAVVSDAGGSRVVETVTPGHPVHVHFTDRLFGDSPGSAAAAFEAIAATAPVTVTVHDVPQPSDGAVNAPRRGDCYRRVIAASRGAVCNSAHELSFLDDLGIVTERDPVVIPLGLGELRSPQPDPARFESVAALIGFVYPGKGHLEVIEAVAGLRAGGALGVVALGAASPGHEADVEALRSTAAGLGVSFAATGFLTDEDLLDRSARVAVPIAAHQHISASGSILSWLAAGRRPLVIDSRYTREMLELRPDTMTLVSGEGMAAAISRALADPGSTVLAPTTSTTPHLTDVAAQYRRWWRGVHW